MLHRANLICSQTGAFHQRGGKLRREDPACAKHVSIQNLECDRASLNERPMMLKIRLMRQVVNGSARRLGWGPVKEKQKQKTSKCHLVDLFQRRSVGDFMDGFFWENHAAGVAREEAEKCDFRVRLPRIFPQLAREVASDSSRPRAADSRVAFAGLHFPVAV